MDAFAASLRFLAFSLDAFRELDTMSLRSTRKIDLSICGLERAITLHLPSPLYISEVQVEFNYNNVPI